jgi:hypothetical protein
LLLPLSILLILARRVAGLIGLDRWLLPAEDGLSDAVDDDVIAMAPPRGGRRSHKGHRAERLILGRVVKFDLGDA